jgi:GTPase SAR1 family protein
MFDIEKKTVTGYVFPVGNGAVGKSSLPVSLRKNFTPATLHQELEKITKTKNLEFEFVTDEIMVFGQPMKIVQQFMIPPGQKAMEGDIGGRSYEEVIDIYRFMIRRIDVVLLSYKITQLDSFQDLEFWINKVDELVNDKTEYILVGTHLDMDRTREVSYQNMQMGTEYISRYIRQMRPEWRGTCSALEVSNLNGENLEVLRKRISYSILRAKDLIN